MKKCAYCGRQNQDTAMFCCECGVNEFERRAEALPEPPVEVPESQSGSRATEPGCPAAEPERRGAMVALKCRTPGEAYLIAEQLEAEDILVALAHEQTVEQEFVKNGYVEIQVSAQAYEAAKSLQSVIGRKYWEERARCAPSLGLNLLALCLSLIAFLGWCVLAVMGARYKAKGYLKKARAMKLWVLFGVICFFVFVSYLIAAS
jgi:hypothetical protein